MAPLIVDDSPIIDPYGDTFDIVEDFDAPSGTRYVSDLHNPAGKPASMRKKKINAVRSAAPPSGGGGGGGGGGGQYTQQYANVSQDERGPPLLHESPPKSAYKAEVGGYGYQTQRSLYGSGRAPYREPYAYHGRPHWGPVSGGIQDMPHPHQQAIMKQLSGMGVPQNAVISGYGGGYDAGPYARPYAAAAGPYAVAPYAPPYSAPGYSRMMTPRAGPPAYTGAMSYERSGPSPAFGGHYETPRLGYGAMGPAPTYGGAGYGPASFAPAGYYGSQFDSFGGRTRSAHAHGGY